MSRHYKPINNGNGTELTISNSKYIVVGPNGTDITIRCGDEVIAFDTLEDMVSSIDKGKCAYYHKDEIEEEIEL